jgi:Rrf2 family transcriptional regulator, nitric oxide-sensitive transcriptional repressor
MKIGAFADVGLRVLMVLGAEPEVRLSTRELSQRVGVPQSHVSKAVTALSHRGWIEVQRGRTGGATVSRAGLDVSIGAVLRSLDTRADVAECTGAAAGDCPLVGACRLRGHLAAAREAFYAALDPVSVRDVSSPASGGAFFASIGLRTSTD